MKLCGLTGGVGMGKSTAAGFLSQHGARIMDTDELARELVQPGRPALAEIRDTFGKNIVAADGFLCRDELAKIVFADAAARKKLEQILHPKIRQRWQSQVEQWRQQNIPLAVVVIPLLFETHAESCFDKIICVACSEKERRERLRARGWNDEQISQRIAAQMPVEEKIARAHFVIWTEGGLADHSAQVERILAAV
ncbi:MAG TPA: dephospho-CoA kinase [Verrucomicrobiae bacterium]|nr:dephospho-CoA kinase [Verrucomicrobiae bacterium]